MITRRPFFRSAWSSPLTRHAMIAALSMAAATSCTRTCPAYSFEPPARVATTDCPPLITTTSGSLEGAPATAAGELEQQRGNDVGVPSLSITRVRVAGGSVGARQTVSQSMKRLGQHSLPGTPWTCTWRLTSDGSSVLCTHDAGGSASVSTNGCQRRELTLVIPPRAQRWSSLDVTLDCSPATP